MCSFLNFTINNKPWSSIYKWRLLKSVIVVDAWTELFPSGRYRSTCIWREKKMECVATTFTLLKFKRCLLWNKQYSKHTGIVMCIYFHLFLYISCIIQFHFASVSKGKEINLSDIIYWRSKHSSLFYQVYVGNNLGGCKFHMLNVSFH